MQKLFCLPILLALSVPATATDAPALATEKPVRQRDGEAQPPVALVDRVRALMRDIEGGAHAQARVQADAVLADPGFARLPPARQAEMRYLAGWLALVAGDGPAGYEHLWQATRAPSAEAPMWEMFARAALVLGRFDEACAALAEMLARFPESTDGLDPLLAMSALYHGDAGDYGPGKRRLLETLFAAGLPLNAVGDGSRHWYELALLRLAGGDRAGTEEAIARIENPEVLVRLLSDRRFDGLAGAPESFDLRRVAERYEAKLRTRALLQPDVLELQVALVHALRSLDAAEAAVALAEATGPAENFVDGDTQWIWMRNALANALLQLGRHEEALRVLAEAAAASRGGHDGVSLVLNHAQVLASLQQPQAALDPLSDLGAMSGYGRLVLVDVQHRAALQTGNAASAAAALAYLREHGTAFPVFATNALLDEGRIDEAAETVVAALADPLTRGDMLLHLQRYREVTLPGDAAVTAGWETLRSREDVAAAVDAHGRILDVPLYR
ncbi:hypothetical protein [Arenimonas composti]|uniref:Tetratrico peptide repeat group 5 domain-containing protein n=1 Tax=Arenimonas composti TR7-09 = DSM 18010 TaxID=1121013 RepID=A0A091BD85_9GAMM|nr:hypothetical protein [Arenimonas composti]KFN49442.1 hypothetical protein P873_10745 [Arenimonas composti TR7-09 = DSM 18010]